MCDSVKSLTVNKEILIRPCGGGRLLKMSAVSNKNGIPTLLINDMPIVNDTPIANDEPIVNDTPIANDEPTGLDKESNISGGLHIDDIGLSPKVGKSKLIQGVRAVSTFGVTDKSCVFITPSSQLPPTIVSGDLTVVDVRPGVGFTIKSFDPVDQCVVDTDTRTFSWFIVN